jgi:long-subunit acyl-CoA synthetase (AMP-forming)
VSHVIECLRARARVTPQCVAIENGHRSMTCAQLVDAVDRTGDRLRALAGAHGTIALLADNGIDWAVADLAALDRRIPIVPLPLFFSASQMLHAIRGAGVRWVISDRPSALATSFGLALAANAVTGNLWAVEVPAPSVSPVCAGTQKITFTSGTTGTPKGVCLSVAQMEATAEALRAATAGRSDDRHLCLLPLPTLLENIGGIYTPLLAGARVIAPPLADIGLAGSSGLDVRRLVETLNRHAPTSLILVPQMLDAILQAVRAGLALPRSLRFVAVGGAPVSAHTLAAAERAGLPVHEGYGLSECASVVALNAPGARRTGSVGRPLPHVQVSIASDGEILIDGIDAIGYLGDAAGPAPGPIATGDLGRFDADGYLYVTGRKKSIFITSFGRNVAPEWVERELVAHAPIAQAAVFGESRPFNSAVIVASGGAKEPAIAAALELANAALPDYARIGAWIAADAPFGVANGQSTPNGRLRRASILAAYADRLEALYQH